MRCFFFSSRRRHTRLQGDWSSDVCSSDLRAQQRQRPPHALVHGLVERQAYARDLLDGQPSAAQLRLHRLHALGEDLLDREDRKSTRLNSSHLVISYAVFCLKKKNRTPHCTALSGTPSVAPSLLCLPSITSECTAYRHSSFLASTLLRQQQRSS